jgi:hypothetical protein
MQTDDILRYAEMIGRLANTEAPSEALLDEIGRYANAIRLHREREIEEAAYPVCEEIPSDVQIAEAA